MAHHRARSRPRVTKALALAVCLFSAPFAAHASANACEPEIIRASHAYGVPVGILYAVGLAETGNKGSLQPNAMNIEGKPLFPASRSAALTAFAKAREDGARLIDVGCMQINVRYHGEKFRSLSDMFDPRQNVEYAARFLRDLKQRHMTWSMAVARYHAGPDNDPAQKRYVCRVIANLVATGYGSWTPNAKAFCQ